MTSEAQPFTLSPLLPDLMFLASQCHGPDFAKSQIIDWIGQVADSKDAAWTLDALKDTCTALVVLAHANAGFRRGETPFGYRGPAIFEIDDRGGYLAAKKLLIEIIDSAPLCDACRSELLTHVLHVFAQHREQLDKLLPKH